MYKALKERVYNANLQLDEYKLILFNWGNVSEIDRELGVIAIKPSGILYKDMSVDDIVIVDLSGNVVEGDKKPSSDLDTHLILYNTYSEIGGVTHTHSHYATAFAQAKKDVRILGTTHADTFENDVLCTRDMTPAEIESNYEHNTGVVIVETLNQAGIDPLKIPAILVASHGPFVWGIDAEDSVKNSVILEEVACLNHISESLNKDVPKISEELRKKHYYRKHGADAYYGQ